MARRAPAPAARGGELPRGRLCARSGGGGGGGAGVYFREPAAGIDPGWSDAPRGTAAAPPGPARLGSAAGL